MKEKGVGNTVFNICNGLFFFLFTLICVFPFYYLFINTISNNELVGSGQINLIPRGFHISNYLSIFKASALQRAAIVTVARTVLGTILMVLTSAFVAFLVTKQAMFARKFIYRFIIITMYFNAGLIPWFLNLHMLGLTNSFWGYIIPAVVQPFNIILVKTYIESLPKELEESAFMDGAGYFTTFRAIIFPLCRPIVATISIFGAVGHWNSFTDSIILMSDSKLHTLQHKLHDYLKTATDLAAAAGAGEISQEMVKESLNNRVIMLTVSMVSIIPILLVYPFMTRYLQKGLILGAVKG
jgi:multiple sugar transport system permease protein/putative aldouronate transport system permease protein